MGLTTTLITGTEIIGKCWKIWGCSCQIFQHRSSREAYLCFFLATTSWIDVGLFGNVKKTLSSLQNLLFSSQKATNFWMKLWGITKKTVWSLEDQLFLLGFAEESSRRVTITQTLWPGWCWSSAFLARTSKTLKSLWNANTTSKMRVRGWKITPLAPSTKL